MQDFLKSNLPDLEQKSQSFKENRAFLYADGFFTTFILENGNLAAFEKHFFRLVDSCNLSGLEIPFYLQNQTEFKRFLASQIPFSKARLRVRFMIWRAEGKVYSVPEKSKFDFAIIVKEEPIEASLYPIYMVDVEIPRISSQALSGKVKWICGVNSILAQTQAQKKGGNLALQLSSKGFISETAYACIAWFENGILKTPSVSCDILEGTCRADFLDFCAHQTIEIQEVEASLNEVKNIESWLVLNANFGARTIDSFNENPCFYSSENLEIVNQFALWRTKKAVFLYD